MVQENLQLRVGATGLAESIRREASRAEAQLASRPIKLSLDTKGFRQPLGRITHDVSEFNKSMDASVARVLAFGAAMGVINSVSNAMKAMASQAIKVEKALKDVNVILNLNNSQLAKFGDQLFDVARKTSQSFDTVSDAAVEFARQGLGAEETLKRINDAMVLSRLSGLKAADSVNSLTAAVNSYAKVGITTTQVINRLANVDAAFAVSSADLANAIQRAGASAQGAKVEFNELLAVVTSVQQQTARGGAVIGNAFKSIFTRLQRSGVRDALEELGVATENTNGSLRSGIAVLRDYAKVYGTLTDQQKAYTDSQIAGLFQINNLKALLADLTSEYSIYDKALKTADTSTNQAIQRNEELNKTLSSLLLRTGASIDELASKLGELGASEGISRLVNMVKSVADFLNGVLGNGEDEGNTFAKNLVRGIGGFLTGPGLVIVGAALAKVFGQVAKFGVSAFKEILGLNVEAKRQESLQKAIGVTLASNEKLYAQIMGLAGNTAQQEQVLLNYIKQETKERLAQEQIMKRIAASTAFTGIGAGATGFAPAGKRGARKIGKQTLGMSGGFVPNFRKNPSQSAEFMGMMAGGYSKKALRNPKIKKTKIHDGKGGSFFAQTNGHENIKTFTNLSGKKATMVVPEKQSSAYKNFTKTLRKKVASGGFVPNFAKALPSGFMTPGKDGTVRGGGKDIVSKQIIDATKLVSMLVPDASGVHVTQGGVKMPEGHIQRVRFIQVGPKKKAGAETQRNLDRIARGKIIEGSRNFSNFLDREIPKGPITPPNRSEWATTAGRIFEAGIRSVLKSPSFGSETATFDFLGGDKSKGGVFDWNTPLADAKTSSSSKNRASMAAKTIQFLGGGQKAFDKEYKKDIKQNPAAMGEIKKGIKGALGDVRIVNEAQTRAMMENNALKQEFAKKRGRATGRFKFRSAGYIPSFFDLFGGASNMGVDHLGAASGQQRFSAPMGRMVSETGSKLGKNLWKALEALGVSSISKTYSLTSHNQSGFDEFVKRDSTAKKYAKALNVKAGSLGAHKGDFFELYNAKQKFGKDWKSGLSHADLPFDTKQPHGGAGIGESKAFDIMKGKSAAGQQANVLTKSLFSDSDRGLFKGISNKIAIGPADSSVIKVPSDLAAEMKSAGYNVSDGKTTRADVKRFAKASLLGWRKTYNERKFQRAILKGAPMFKGNLKIPATAPFAGRNFRGRLVTRRGLRSMGASGGYIPNFARGMSLNSYFKKEMLGKRFGDLNKMVSNSWQSRMVSGQGLSMAAETGFKNRLFSSVAKTFPGGFVPIGSNPMITAENWAKVPRATKQQLEKQWRELNLSTPKPAQPVYDSDQQFYRDMLARRANMASGFLGQGVREAVKREQAVSGQKAVVERSKFLGGGIGVYNKGQQRKYGSLDRTIQRDHLGQGQLRSTLGRTGSGKEKYAADGFLPNFVRADKWRSRYQPNRRSSKKKRYGGGSQKQNQQANANMFVGLGDKVTKLQGAAEKFHLDKWDDILQGFFSGGYVPNFQTIYDQFGRPIKPQAPRPILRPDAVSAAFGGPRAASPIGHPRHQPPRKPIAINPYPPSNAPAAQPGHRVVGLEGTNQWVQQPVSNRPKLQDPSKPSNKKPSNKLAKEGLKEQKKVVKSNKQLVKSNKTLEQRIQKYSSLVEQGATRKSAAKQAGFDRKQLAAQSREVRKVMDARGVSFKEAIKIVKADQVKVAHKAASGLMPSAPAAAIHLARDAKGKQAARLNKQADKVKSRQQKARLKNEPKPKPKTDPSKGGGGMMGAAFMIQMGASMVLPYAQSFNEEQREGTKAKAASQAAENALTTTQFAMFLAFIPKVGALAAGAVIGISALVGALDGLKESNEEAADRISKTTDSRNKRGQAQSEARSGLMQSVAELRRREKAGDPERIRTARDNVLGRLGGISNNKDRSLLQSMVDQGASTKEIATAIEKIDNRASNESRARNRLSFVTGEAIENRAFGQKSEEIDSIFQDSASSFSASISNLEHKELQSFRKALDDGADKGKLLSSAFEEMREQDQLDSGSEAAKQARAIYGNLGLTAKDIDRAEKAMKLSSEIDPRTGEREISQQGQVALREARGGNQAALKAIIVAMREGNKRAGTVGDTEGDSAARVAGLNKALERFGSELTFSEKMFKQYNSMLDASSKHQVDMMSLVGRGAIELSSNFAKSAIDLTKNVAEFNVEFNQRLGSVGTFEAIDQRFAARRQAMQRNFNVDQMSIDASEQLEQESLRQTTNNRFEGMSREYNNSIRRSIFDAAFSDPEKRSKEDRDLQTKLKEQIASGDITLENVSSIIGSRVVDDVNLKANENKVAQQNLKDSKQAQARLEKEQEKLGDEIAKSKDVIKKEDERLKSVGMGREFIEPEGMYSLFFDEAYDPDREEGGFLISGDNDEELFRRAKAAGLQNPGWRAKVGDAWTERGVTGGYMTEDLNRAQDRREAASRIAAEARSAINMSEKDIKEREKQMERNKKLLKDIKVQRQAFEVSAKDTLPDVTTFESDIQKRSEMLGGMTGEPGKEGLAGELATEMERQQIQTAARMREVADENQRQQQKIGANAAKQTIELELQRRIMEEQLRVEEEQAKKMAALDRLDKLSAGLMATDQIKQLEMQASINTEAGKGYGSQGRVMAAESNRQIAQITGLNDMFSKEDRLALAEFNVDNMARALERGGARGKAAQLRDNFAETRKQIESGEIQDPFLSETEKLNQSIRDLNVTIQNRLITALETFSSSSEIPNRVEWPPSMNDALNEVSGQLDKLNNQDFRFGEDRQNLGRIRFQQQANKEEKDLIDQFLKDPSLDGTDTRTIEQRVQVIRDFQERAKDAGEDGRPSARDRDIENAADETERLVKDIEKFQLQLAKIRKGGSVAGMPVGGQTVSPAAFLNGAIPPPSPARVNASNLATIAAALSQLDTGQKDDTSLLDASKSGDASQLVGKDLDLTNARTAAKVRILAERGFDTAQIVEAIKEPELTTEQKAQEAEHAEAQDIMLDAAARQASLIEGGRDLLMDPLKPFHNTYLEGPNKGQPFNPMKYIEGNGSPFAPPRNNIIPSSGQNMKELLELYRRTKPQDLRPDILKPSPDADSTGSLFDSSGLEEKLKENSEQLAFVSESLAGFSSELLHNFNGNISVDFPAALSGNEALQASLQAFGEQVQMGVRQAIQEELDRRIGGLGLT